MNAEVEDLDALFDQVAAQAAAKVEPVCSSVVEQPKPEEKPAPQGAEKPADMFHRIGSLTRTLHDALRELGYDRSIENAAAKLPDARDRLNYIATLTGQAAERALAAVERGQALLKSDAEGSAALAARWDRLHEGKLSVEEFKALAGDTRAHFKKAPENHAALAAQFHEVMMAQDFHDLTGQVINRIVPLAQCLEQQLCELLLDARPAEVKAAGETEWLSGPAMNAAARGDVVANQSQVDDLLESLGF